MLHCPDESRELLSSSRTIASLKLRACRRSHQLPCAVPVASRELKLWRHHACMNARCRVIVKLCSPLPDAAETLTCAFASHDISCRTSGSWARSFWCVVSNHVLKGDSFSTQEIIAVSFRSVVNSCSKQDHGRYS